MTSEQLQNELSQVLVLRHLTYPVLRRIVQTGRLVEAKAGQTVIAPGFGSRGFFVIISGSIQVQSTGGVVLGYLGPRQYFGEISLLDGVERTASCKANADSVLFEMPAQIFHTDLVTNPMVKAGMVATAKLRLAVQNNLKPGAPAAPARPAAVPAARPAPTSLPPRATVPAARPAPASLPPRAGGTPAPVRPGFSVTVGASSSRLVA
ncbi:MAG: cyclic nucleotide-binding domain-containing protein [Chloroflexota bacterium]